MTKFAPYNEDHFRKLKRNVNDNVVAIFQDIYGRIHVVYNDNLGAFSQETEAICEKAQVPSGFIHRQRIRYYEAVGLENYKVLWQRGVTPFAWED